MRIFLGITLILCLLTGGLNAQSVEKKRGAGDGATASKASTPSANAAAIDELVGLLPASDLIAVVDVGRTINDLMPRLTDLGVGGPGKWAKELQEFTLKTGIDLAKARNAVVGLKIPGSLASGAMIVNGLDLDDKKLEAAMKAYNTEFKASEYKGKQIFNLAKRGNSLSAGPLSLKTDELAIVALGQQKLVFGDLTLVKGVIDIHSGSAKGGITKEMSGALNETRNSALTRFALNLPEHLRQEALNQGDLFTSVAAIKVIMGTLDVGNDLSLSLDMIMRTPSQNEAAELESGLKGLISLARGFLSGGDPKWDVYGQLLDQLKIGSKINDVSLSLTMPRSLVDQLSKKSANGEKK
jgi:hypothetical protein